MQTASKRVVRLGLMGLVCVLGCSSNDDEQPSAGARDTDTTESGGEVSSATSSSRCGMVSQAEVKSILGIDDLGPAELMNESGARAYCIFATPRSPVTVSVIYNTDAHQADYDLERNGYLNNGIPFMDITDFGDVALVSTLGPINTVFVLDGTKMIQVAASAPLDQVRTLTELYLERL